MLLHYFEKLLFRSERCIWNRQYARGYWDLLKHPLEEARFNAVRCMIQKYAANGRILEVGCGEGLLQSGLSEKAYTQYVAIDISKVAIKKASGLQTTTTRYLCADMEKYIPGGKFDLVVFNESLYYSRDPYQLLQRYMNYLAPGGFIITSIFETPNNRRIMNIIEKKFKPLDSKVTENNRGCWHCRVYAGAAA